MSDGNDFIGTGPGGHTRRNEGASEFTIPQDASGETGDERSQLGLDEDHGFLQKLGQFLTVLVVGPLIGLLLLAALMQPMAPVWRFIAHAIVDTLVVFWVLLLVFIWWRPPWLRRIYASTERKVIFITSLASLVCLFVIGFEVLVGWLREMKVL